MEENRVVVSRVFNAPIEKVYDAWVKEDQLSQWHCPENMTAEATSDGTVGGKLRIVMHAPDGKTHIVNGMYKTVDAPNKLAFTWKWESDDKGPDTVVTVEFKRVGDNKTEVTLTHSGFANADSAKGHNKGWVSTFNKLEKFLS